MYLYKCQRNFNQIVCILKSHYHCQVLYISPLPEIFIPIRSILHREGCEEKNIKSLVFYQTPLVAHPLIHSAAAVVFRVLLWLSIIFTETQS